MRIKPTNTCNHNCWYCGYQNSDSDISLGEGVRKGDRLPYDKMVEISEDLVSMGVKAVTFTGGGEPLTYKHIEEFADRLLSGGIQVSLLTNGALLTGKRADIFANRATWIRVSMDGWDDESYQYYRRSGEREFTRISKNLGDFSKIKGATVLGAAINVDNRNYQHLYEFLSHLEQLGVDNVKLAPVIISNDHKENNSYHKELLPTVLSQIERASESLAKESFEIINHYHLLDETFERGYHRCPFAECLTVIAADQKVYTCQDKAYTEGGLVGSIKEQSFAELWASDSCRERIRGLDPSVSCRHHCVASTKNEQILSFLEIDPAHRPFV